MNEKQHQRNQKLIFAFLYGFLAFGVIYVMTSGGMGVSFDSEKYLLMAKYLNEGEWENAFNTTWLPFYPMTIALTTLVGLSPGVDAARMVSIICFVVSIMVVFFLGLQIQGKATAHLSTLSVLIFAPLVYTFSYCWSETVYIMLSLLFLLLLTLFLNAPEEKNTRYLVGSAILAGLGFFTRYLGFSLIGTGLLVIFFLGHRDRPSKRFKEMLLFGSVGILPMLFNLLMCFVYLGTITRKTAPSEFSFFQQLIRFFATFYHDFLSFALTFQKYEFFFTNLKSWDKFNSAWFWFNKIILLCLIVFAVFFIKFVFSSKSFRSLLRPQIGLVVHVAVYSVVLIGITSKIYLDPMGTRFTTPLYPLIMLLVFSNIFHVSGTFASRKLKWLFFYLAILGIHLFWGIQLVSTASVYKGISSGSFPAMEHPGNRNRTSLKFLQENISSDDLVITNIPDKLSYIWPREPLYLSVSTGGLNQVLNQIIYESSRRSVYVMICTEDYSHYFITDIEEINEKTGLFAWRKIFGNDYIYKTKAVVYDSSMGNIKRGQEKNP